MAKVNRNLPIENKQDFNRRRKFDLNLEVKVPIYSNVKLPVLSISCVKRMWYVLRFRS